MKYPPSHEHISDLFRDLNKYYPIGTSTPNADYQGYQDLLAIIASKINSIINDEQAAEFVSLMQKVNEYFPGMEVMDESNKQFPNYAFYVDLHRKDIEELRVNYRLKVRVSLLTSYFSVFFEEEILHKSFSSFNTIHQDFRTVVISSNSLIADVQGRYIDAIKSMIENVFLNYTFVEHFALFNKKVSFGSPHGLEYPGLEQEYPIFAFLFDNEYGDMKNVGVAY